MNKIFSLLWGISIVALSAISCTFAYTQEQQEAYQWAYKYGITTQPTIEAANLNWNLTRQAFAKMVVNYLENVVWVKQATSNSCYFPDESKITNDLKPYAKKACTYQIMWKNGSAFKPTDIVDRAQLWTVFSRILWGDRHDVGGKWYYIYHVNALKDAGIMNDISNVSGVPAKRWDVMLMFKRTYEKFGSNIYLNSWSQASKTTVQTNKTATQTGKTISQTSSKSEDSDNEYVSSMYNNSNVIYTWKDGTKYYYDYKFLALLRSAASKKWESDLAKYLEIEARYFKNWLDQLSDLYDEELLKSMWIDVDNIDPENMTKKEKEELVKKFRTALGKIIDENKTKNNNLLKDFEKVTKNIGKDQFWLKEKYNETKTFMEATNTFLDLYSNSVLDLVEIALTQDEEDSEEWMAQALWLIWVALAYQWEADKYQKYVDEWGANTVKLLWLD